MSVLTALLKTRPVEVRVGCGLSLWFNPEWAGMALFWRVNKGNGGKNMMTAHENIDSLSRHPAVGKWMDRKYLSSRKIVPLVFRQPGPVLRVEVDWFERKGEKALSETISKPGKKVTFPDENIIHHISREDRTKGTKIILSHTDKYTLNYAVYT